MRYTNRIFALYESNKRFLKAKYMFDFVDNYYINGKLKAWAKHVIKYNTYRAMWFYRSTEVCKMYL